jgi:phosphoglucosamine mutase
MTLFGTDGIRDRAGEGNLAPERVERLGVVIGRLLRVSPGVFRPARRMRTRRARPDNALGKGKVLIGWDTRPSGPEIVEALVRGLGVFGAEAVTVGIVPTPAVAWLTARWGCALGVVVSASHNPAADNGIKLFGPDGRKIPDAAERAIEELFFSREFDPKLKRRTGGGAVDVSEHAVEYVEALHEAAGRPDLSGWTIVADAGHGAATPWVRRVFEPLGARVRMLHETADGARINDGCGATHPQVAAAAVGRESADVGVAFDGDADRVILADRTGTVRNGEDILWIASDSAGDVIVSTVMANLGLERALAARGIRLVRTPVGDRYVAEAMEQEGAKVGGEPSGHIIFREHAPMGDGLLTALLVFRILRERGALLEQACTGWTRFPQVLRNVRVREKRPWEDIAPLRAEVEEARRALGEGGRVLVRYSGTEPVLRIMVEGADAESVARWADRIAHAAQESLG